jgi:hypothetical protein
VANETEPPRFACDAMMRGLARWLRSCGYDATWTYGIDDDELLRQAVEQDRVVLTADGGIVRRPEVARGEPAVHYVPNELPPRAQAVAVLRHFALPLRTPRCMACGGERRQVPKESVADEAPPRSYLAFDRFFRCQRCGRLLWAGTHWERIDAQLRELARDLSEPPTPADD